jgi:hypothetical protein
MRTPTVDGFLRNEGVGTWEANLAAFLVDLNTNMWPYPLDNANGSHYDYQLNPAALSRGSAFDDALGVLRYRYNGNFKNLASVANLFGPVGVNVFTGDGLDGYTDGPLMTNWFLPGESGQPDPTSFSWVGADNPQHYFTTQELYDRSKTAIGIGPAIRTFSDRLVAASTNVSSYDRSTFFRLVSQLGTDSVPDPPDKMNLNWDNLVQSNQFTGVKSATNFIPWRAVDFFTNAAIRLLTSAGYAVGANPAPFAAWTNILAVNSGVTNIQIMVYPTNFYTPSVHRMFQLAANIYDATTDRTLGRPAPAFPTIFKPLFVSRSGGNTIYLVGFQEVTNKRL